MGCRTEPIIGFMPENAIISSLGEKIARLIEDNRSAHGERDRLAKECDRLKTENRELKQAAASLEKRVKVLELGQSITGGSGDTKQAKARINRLMREIDRCIALMNR